jgi:16S rRNA G966 N2-methylase RsmD
MLDYSIAELNGLKLAWRRGLDGGGQSFGLDYVPVVEHLFGHVGRLFEFCAGPGYIGFSLLALGHCDHLVLSDVNPRAIDAIRETVRLNTLEDRVTVYESDGLADIPADERWDLVVANPPHFATQYFHNPSLLTDDPGWRLHRDFYRSVGDHLAPGGSLLIQENSEGSALDDFLPFMAEGGLCHVRTLWYSGNGPRPFYFLWVKKALPGLVPEERATLAIVPLRESPGPPITAPAGRPCALRLVNETGRPLWARLVTESGTKLFARPVEMTVDSEAELPPISLSPGGYEVREKPAGTVLGQIVAR